MLRPDFTANLMQQVWSEIVLLPNKLIMYKKRVWTNCSGEERLDLVDDEVLPGGTGQVSGRDFRV